MMGTLARVLAEKGIDTPADRYRAEVSGEISDVNGVLRITRIHVQYFLKTEKAKEEDARSVLGSYISRCPAAQSVIGCIDITHDLTFE